MEIKLAAKELSKELLPTPSGSICGKSVIIHTITPTHIIGDVILEWSNGVLTFIPFLETWAKDQKGKH
jgi:hypothetical protein